MAARPATKRTPPRKRGMTDTTRAAVRNEPAQPNGEAADSLAGTLERQLLEVVGLVKMLADREASDERLVELAQRVMELKPATVTFDTFVAPPQPPGTYLDREQQQLALTYDAFRTALGRVGAASIVLYTAVLLPAGYELEAQEEFVPDREKNVLITIVYGHVDQGSSIVVYGHRDGTWGELGRTQLDDKNPAATICGVSPSQIERLEVLDRSGQPVRLGCQLSLPDSPRPQ